MTTMFKGAFVAFVSVLSVASLAAADHTFVFRNQCGYTISPKIASVNCGYSPRCSSPGSGGVPNPAIGYGGPQPNNLGPGQSQAMTVNRQFNGRVFAQNGHCGGAGENCSLGEFNLDTGSQWTPQAYDLSNIQGFTQSMRLEVSGCDTVACTNAQCGCHNAYPIGDTSGCGNDSPVRGCSAGDKTFTVTFCP